MRVDRHAAILFACGAPESGKSHRLKAELDRLKPDRLIAIDPDGEYDGWGYLHERVADVVKATAGPSFRTRFRPSIDRSIAERQFDLICQLARWHVDPQPGQAPPPRVAPIVVLVDELADLVGPSFRDAPASWRWLVRRGRKYGVAVLAASQRPEEIDKAIFNMASTLSVRRLNDPVTARRLGGALGVPAAAVMQLQGFEAIERDKRTGALQAPARIAIAGDPGRVRPRSPTAAMQARASSSHRRAKRGSRG